MKALSIENGLEKGVILLRHETKNTFTSLDIAFAVDFITNSS